MPPKKKVKDPNDLSNLKVAELKERLRQHGLPISGLKQVLVDRLTAHLASQGANASSSSTTTKAATSAVVERVPPVARKVVRKEVVEKRRKVFSAATAASSSTEDSFLFGSNININSNINSNSNPPSSLFGSNINSNPPASLFGSNINSNPLSSSPFGINSNSPSSLFGSNINSNPPSSPFGINNINAPSSLFGNSNSNAQQQSSPFGSNSYSSSPTPTPTPTPTFTFGASVPTAAFGTAFPTTVTAPSSPQPLSSSSSSSSSSFFSFGQTVPFVAPYLSTNSFGNSVSDKSESLSERKIAKIKNAYQPKQTQASSSVNNNSNFTKGTIAHNSELSSDVSAFGGGTRTSMYLNEVTAFGGGTQTSTYLNEVPESPIDYHQFVPSMELIRAERDRVRSFEDGRFNDRVVNNDRSFNQSNTAIDTDPFGIAADLLKSKDAAKLFESVQPLEIPTYWPKAFQEQHRRLNDLLSQSLITPKEYIERSTQIKSKVAYVDRVQAPTVPTRGAPSASQKENNISAVLRQKRMQPIGHREEMLISEIIKNKGNNVALRELVFQLRTLCNEATNGSAVIFSKLQTSSALQQIIKVLDEYTTVNTNTTDTQSPAVSETNTTNTTNTNTNTNAINLNSSTKILKSPGNLQEFLALDIAHVLACLANARVTYVRAIIELNGVVPLVRLGHSPMVALREAALSALSPMTSTAFECRMIADAKLIATSDLIVFASDESVVVQELGVNVLYNVCCYSHSHVEPWPVLRLIPTLLAHTTQQVRESAATCVQKLATEAPVRKHLIETQTLLVQLSNLLLEVPPACSVFCELAAWSDSECDAMIELGVLSRLAALLSMKISTIYEREIAWATSNILAGTPKQRDAAIQAGLVRSTLRLLIDEKANQVHTEAAYAAKVFLDVSNIDAIRRITNITPIPMALLSRLHATEVSNISLLTPLLGAIKFLLTRARPLVDDDYIRQMRGGVQRLIKHSEIDTAVKTLAQDVFDHCQVSEE